MAKIRFGELEQSILDAVWRRGPSTVREVLSDLGRRAGAYTTIMTVMNRLTAQGVLRRRMGQQGAFTYHPTKTRDELCAAATRASLDELVRQYGEVALAQFIERLDAIPEQKVRQLRERLKKNHRNVA